MFYDEKEIDRIAQAAHAAIGAYAHALGEPAQPVWAEAEEWMREASRTGVRFRLAHPDAPHSAQHEQWMEEKRQAGWRAGASKDVEARTHPMLRPYEELPETEKRKDALFAAIVRALSEPV